MDPLLPQAAVEPLVMKEVAERPLRVAMFAPGREKCGISDYTHHLVEALRKLQGIAEVRMVAAPTALSPNGLAQALLRYGALERLFRTLGLELNSQDADLAHIQHQFFFFGGVAPHKNHVRALLNAARLPLVMTVHEIARPLPTSGALQRRLIALANRRNFLHPVIRGWIVHTTADQEALVALGVPHAAIHVLPVGAPPADPMPDVETAKRALGLQGRRVVTLFGFLAQKKGHLLALEALNALPPDAVLLFAGDRHPDDHTDYVARLQTALEAPECAGRARITGYLPEAEIPFIMAATDVAIAPFLTSSGSASLAHCFAYARAIVASDIPPHVEILRNAPGCLALFRSEDSRDLAARIREVLEHDATRMALQDAAREYAESRSYERVAERTLAIYRAVAR